MKKALILYASMSGNTEKIAHAFEEVFRLYGFQVDLYKAEGKKLSEKQVYFEDYDFICIGSGLIGGQPMPQLSKLLALHGPDAGIFYREGAGWEHANRGEDRKGLAFLTYGGSFFGPDETEAAMGQVRLWLNEHGVHALGSLPAGPGDQYVQNGQVGRISGGQRPEATEVFDRFMAQPDDPEFGIRSCWSC